MINSLNRYGTCDGCAHLRKRVGLRETELWCLALHRKLNSVTEFFDHCKAKKPIDGALQDIIYFH